MIAIDMILHNTSLSSAARMELIYRRAREWDVQTDNSTGRFTAKKEADQRTANSTIYAPDGSAHSNR
jgi:hypothetical protein